MTRRYAFMTAVAALFVASVVANADVVLDWNQIMVATVSSQNPFAQARFAAITQLAVFEAVNAAAGHFTPYLGTISAPPGSSAEAAAIAAAHTVLKSYFPAAAASLDAARAGSLASIPDGQAKTNGIAVGEAAAAAMIAARANDGAGAPAVLPAGFVGARPMAINAGLFCGGRHHVAVAECDSIRRPELEPVPLRSAAGPHQRPVCEKLW